MYIHTHAFFENEGIAGQNVKVEEVIVLKIFGLHLRKDDKCAKWINVILCAFATYNF
jgi:hypothetical protein